MGIHRTKFQRLWDTKNTNDEWWSSFVTSPLAILANVVVVEWAWLTPNKITLLSLIVGLSASVCMVVGGFTPFVIAVLLINASHILDCMDGQMAKYRGESSRFGNYFDKVSDQIQIFFWFSAVAYAGYQADHDVTPVFLAFTGVAFYSLRVYVKYVTIFIEVEHDKDYLDKSSARAGLIRKESGHEAGLGAGFMDNFRWFMREQRKFFLFNEAVFVFMISVALLFDQIVPMLWVFAVSQVYYGFVRCWQRGRQIYLGRHQILLKPMEK